MEDYILIVDDQILTRSILQQFLQESGYKVQCATNGRECLDIACSSEKPYLILLDYNMPEITGLEVLAMLRKKETTKDIPVIMLTASENIKDKAMSYDAATVLARPLDFHALIEAIRKV